MATAAASVATTQEVGGSAFSRFGRWISSPRVFPWALVLPACLLLLIMAIGPTFYVVVLSFIKYTPGQPLKFAGLSNFIRAFQTDRFWRGLYVTSWFVFVSIGIQLVLGFTNAMALQRVGRRFRYIATTIMLIPMMIAPTVVGVLWKMIYKARYGALNYGLEQIGIIGPDWLADKWAALGGLIIADVWEWTPFMTILLLAGLQSLSQEVYEAAYVDGSTAWQVFKNMTIPLMRPFIFLAVFLRMIDAWKTFDLIFGVTRGGPGDFTESIAWYTYKVGFTYFELGYAAALSFLQLLVIIILGRFLLRQLGRVREESRAT
jgi:multiple sugar transport system permease protein